MFLFPIIYLVSFIYGLWQLWQKKLEGFLLFTIAGLPIYINALSLSYILGFASMVPLLQSFKEVMLLAGGLLVASQIRERPKLHFIDQMMLAYIALCILYVILPVGSYGVGAKLIAFKNLALFPLIYAIGRFCSLETISLKKTTAYISIIGCIAAVVVLGERLSNMHLQNFTGYAEYLSHYFESDPSGSYGLSWTFETESGMKRFASIYANPLEHAASTVVLFAFLLVSITHKEENSLLIQTDRLTIITFLASLICIFLAASRASFLSYFIVLYVYAWIIRYKPILRFYHSLAVLAILYVVFLLQGDLYDFIIDTITFENTSSLGHVLEWIAGIEAMINNPLGMGLGESGRVSVGSGLNTGGENQFIIIGVQIGVIGMLLYMLIYGALIQQGIQTMRHASGKRWKLALLIVLLKVGLLIPAFTANIDAYIYITYLTWFFSGYFMQSVMSAKDKGVDEKEIA